MIEDDAQAKLKKQIGADNISEDERNALFKKFVDKGGKVLSNTDFEKTEAQLKENKKHTSDSKDYEKRAREEKRNQEKRKKTKKAVSSKDKTFSQDGLFKRMILNSRCMMKGITSINGKMTDNFFNIFRNKIHMALLNIAFVLKDCMYLKRGGLEKFKAEVLPQAPLNYELMVRMLELYDQKMLDGIFNKYSDERSGYLNAYSYRDYFSKLFKQIYALRDYRLQCIDACSIAIEVKQKKDGLSKEKIIEYFEKTREAVTTLFINEYEVMFLAYCKSIGQNLYMEDKEKIEKSLCWKDDDYVGKMAQKSLEEYRKAQKDRAYPKKEITEDDESDADVEITTEDASDKDTMEVSESENIDSRMTLGMKIIDEIIENAGTYLDRLEQSDIFQGTERMAKIYIFMEEFEKHFSFILTSSKIAYNIYFKGGTKIDFRSELANIYMSFNQSRDEMDNYLKLKREEVNSLNDESIPDQQSRRLVENLKPKLKKAERIIIETFYAVCSNLEKILLTILENPKDIIKEPNLKLRFDNYDGPKRLNGYTSIKAIRLCYSLVLAVRVIIDRQEL